ncbi:MAG: radical SAM protein, partial [Clostridia bacterium]|nr:radical SAM protein [Clostridia bacterium]
MFYSLEKGLFIVDESEISQRKIAVPLAVNWNIAGNCTNSCFYCYGKDIAGTPLPLYYNKIADSILSLSPEMVVFSGGEPLLESKFEYAVCTICGKTNLILDTNGILIDDERVKFLKDKRFHVRVSLDSEDPVINERNRLSRIDSSTVKIKNNILKLVEAGVPVTVQTTVTDNNYNYLESLGEYLEKTGVRNWRIAAVIPSDDVFK